MIAGTRQRDGCDLVAERPAGLADRVSRRRARRLERAGNDLVLERSREMSSSANIGAVGLDWTIQGSIPTDQAASHRQVATRSTAALSHEAGACRRGVDVILFAVDRCHLNEANPLGNQRPRITACGGCLHPNLAAQF